MTLANMARTMDEAVRKGWIQELFIDENGQVWYQFSYEGREKLRPHLGMKVFDMFQLTISNKPKKARKTRR